MHYKERFVTKSVFSGIHFSGVGLLQNTLGVTKIAFGENLFLFGVLEITFGVLGAGLFMNKTGQERTLFLPC